MSNARPEEPPERGVVYIIAGPKCKAKIGPGAAPAGDRGSIVQPARAGRERPYFFLFALDLEDEPEDPDEDPDRPEEDERPDEEPLDRGAL